MLDVLIWLGLGAVIGALASLLTRHDTRHAPWRNVAVGAVGALLAGLIVSPMLGRPSVNFGAFNLGPLLASGLGAAMLLLAVNLIERSRAARRARAGAGSPNH